MTSHIYGVMAQFPSPEILLDAVHALRDDPAIRLEAYTPFAVEGLSDALRLPPNRVPLATLIGGLVGGLGAYFVQWYAAVISFPINVGGRPLHSWPLFVPVSFEMTILFGAFTAVIAMLVANGLPRLRHPVFNTPGFTLASRNRFFLCVRGSAHSFDYSVIEERLSQLGAEHVCEVPM